MSRKAIQMAMTAMREGAKQIWTQATLMSVSLPFILALAEIALVLSAPILECSILQPPGDRQSKLPSDFGDPTQAGMPGARRGSGCLFKYPFHRHPAGKQV